MKILLIMGVILLITLGIATAYNYFTRKYIERTIRLRHVDPTGYEFIRHIVSAIIYIVGFGLALEQIPELRTLGHSLLAGAGIISVVAGLASQQALSNIMSGVLIVLFKPFKISDRITVQGSFTGIVEHLNLRHVVIRDIENNRIIIPNSVISTEIITNAQLTDERVCKMIDVGVGYASDIDRALAILGEVVAAHPLQLDNRSTADIKAGAPEVVVKVIGLGTSSVNLRAYSWASNTANGFTMYYDVLATLKKRYDAEGIEIPYEYRNVIISNPRQEGIGAGPQVQ
ncbi:mechanosensitive ion channel family protein [Neolewinella maritima]|nr:mechanosensitive ion channel family protein [Neolewinella maritima]